MMGVINFIQMRKKLFKIDAYGIKFDFVTTVGRGFRDAYKIYGMYEPIMTKKFIDVLNKINNKSIFIDIGCAGGYYSVLASKLGCDEINGIDCLASHEDDFYANVPRGIFHLKKFPDKEFIKNLLGDSKTQNKTIVVKIDTKGNEIDILRDIFYFSDKIFIELQPKEVWENIDKYENTLETKKFEYCVNHRGYHRGMVEPFREIGFEEFKEIMKLNKNSEESFVLYIEN